MMVGKETDLEHATGHLLILLPLTSQQSRKKLQEYTYSTQTRGERTQASARLIAEAHNKAILGHVDLEYPPATEFTFRLRA